MVKIELKDAEFMYYDDSEKNQTDSACNLILPAATLGSPTKQQNNKYIKHGKVFKIL